MPLLLQEEGPRDSSESDPPPADPDHRLGGESSQREGGGDEEGGPVDPGQPGEPEPGGGVQSTRKPKGEAEVEDEEGEASPGRDLSRLQRLAEPAGAEPEESGEVDAGGRGELRVKVVAQVDESR